MNSTDRIGGLTDPAMSDATLAALIAGTAGKLLLQLRCSTLFDGKTLGKIGDQTANAFILSALQHHRPQDAVLSEEEKDCAARLSASRVWIVDPLDGTREYGEGRSDWAVHIALAIDGKAAIGAVALPALSLTLTSSQPPQLPKTVGKARMLVSRTRPAPEALAVARKLDAELIPMGSAGAKAMAVLRGEADIYLHSGGQYEWDSCAPVAVAQAAGLHVSRIDGSTCLYNRENPYMPDLLICRPEYAKRVLKALKELSSPTT
jgi:3'(2'), 5'-bisphosphate nucleotidase